MTGPYNNRSQITNTNPLNGRLLVIIPLNHLAYDKIKLIEKMFSDKHMEPPSMEVLDAVVDNVFIHLSFTFMVSVKDLRITNSIFDCSDTPEYTSSLQIAIDSLMFDLTKLGLNVDLQDCYEVIQDCELSMINEICSYIPNFDEAYMVITNTNYRQRFNFFITIETNPEFKGF